MRSTRTLLCFSASVLMAPAAFGAFVIEPDIDGLDDALFTPSPNFSFGGDTTTASTSIAMRSGPTGSTTPLIGTTGGDSLFGGDGVALPDTYLYSYTPGVDGSNRSLPAGASLNDDGDVAFGLPGGATGTYRVYATWPQSQNNSGGPVRYTLNNGATDIATVDVIQNEDVDLLFFPNANNVGVPAGSRGVDGNLQGNEWFFLFEVDLDSSTAYSLSQSPTVANSFVSMRSGGVLFQLIPEPAAGLLALAGLALAPRRRV